MLDWTHFKTHIPTLLKHVSVDSQRYTLLNQNYTDKVVESVVISQLITLGTKATTGSGNEAWGLLLLLIKTR